MGKIRNNQINRLFLQYNIRLDIQQVKIRGFRHYEIRNIFMEKTPVAFEIQRLELFLSVWTLIKERSIRNALNITLDKLQLTYHRFGKDAGKPNVLSPDVRKITAEWEGIYYRKYEKIINAFFSFIPERVVIRELKVQLPQRDLYVLSSVECIVNKKDRSVTAAIDRIETQTGNCLSPFSVSHVSICFKQEEIAQGGKVINWMVRSTDLRIQHQAIGAAPLLISNFDAELNINFTPTSLVVTKESGGNINQIPFAFQFHHDLVEKDILKFIFHVELDFNLFKSSFPAFHVKAIETVTTEGNLLIRSRLMFSIKDPMQHFFELKVLKNDLVIDDPGELDLSYLEAPFVHRVIRNNAFLREIWVGDLNSNFVKIEDFPAQMIPIIIFCEDPNFYQHHGLDVFFVGRAIVSNLVERKFKRGASTITMQLVRNLFLNHEKNLYRKIEEIILSLLIENYFRIPKARLLEIYLNIIEFGPDVYGIKEAAMFYFKKSLPALTMTEYIIMMYIIPRPIHFHEALVSQSPQLFTNLKNHVQWLSQHLRTRQTLTDEEFEKVMSDIETISQTRSIILRDPDIHQLPDLLRVDLSINNSINTRNDLHWAYPLHEEKMPKVNLKKIASADVRKEYIHHIVEWLDVENSRRYAIQGKTTYCNIYAYDVVSCLGAYIPRVWWNEESVRKIKKGIRVPVVYAKTVFEMNCNALAEWFLSYGSCFGWKQVFDLAEMQSLANEGSIGIIVAQRNELSEPGHITVVLPETAAVKAQTCEKEIICPVQSQAGMKNLRFFNGDAWWQDAARFGKYSFWVWDL